MIRSIFSFTTATVAATGFLILTAPAFAAAQDDELEAVRETVSGMFEQIKPEHVQPSPIDGWYTIQKGSIIAYVSSDGRYLLQGDLIDLEIFAVVRAGVAQFPDRLFGDRRWLAGDRRRIARQRQMLAVERALRSPRQ